MNNLITFYDDDMAHDSLPKVPKWPFSPNCPPLFYKITDFLHMGKAVTLLYLYLIKALDTMSHRKGMAKMERLGLRASHEVDKELAQKMTAGYFERTII